MRTILIAHRGDTVNYQENTPLAFQSAFSRGADGIELDIQWQNNKFIVVHDYLFDESEAYPSLEKILEKFGGMGRIEIELKIFIEESISKLSSLINKFPELNYELTSSNLFILPIIRETMPQSSIGAIFSPKEFEEWMTPSFIERKVLETIVTIDANVAHLPITVLSESLILKLHSNKIKVHSHIYKSDINQELSEYQYLNRLSVDQCTFDDIDILGKLK
ncbi:MAG: glycerophosphodiester phosphodiesterase [bacterium]